MVWRTKRLKGYLERVLEMVWQFPWAKVKVGDHQDPPRPPPTCHLQLPCIQNVQISPPPDPARTAKSMKRSYFFHTTGVWKKVFWPDNANTFVRSKLCLSTETLSKHG